MEHTARLDRSNPRLSLSKGAKGRKVLHHVRGRRMRGVDEAAEHIVDISLRCASIR